MSPAPVPASRAPAGGITASENELRVPPGEHHCEVTVTVSAVVSVMDPEDPVIVTVYVAVLDPPPPVPLLLPHPLPLRITMTASNPRSDCQPRRRAGIPKNNTKARANPPAPVTSFFSGKRRAALDAVVDTVSVEVTAPEVTSALFGERLHSTPLAAPDTAHERFTVPAKPFAGVTEIVEVPLLPAPTLIFPLLLSAKDGLAAAATVIETVVDELIVPVAASVAITVAV